MELKAKKYIAYLRKSTDDKEKQNYNNFITLKGGLLQPTKLDGQFPLDAPSPTYTGGIAIGRKFMNQLGVELEYMHTAKRKFSSITGIENSTPPSAIYSNTWNIKSDSVMVNFSADLINEGNVVPYIKAGAGMSRNKSSDNIFMNDSGASTLYNTYGGKTNTSFAWQGGAGLNVSLNSRFEVQVEYMFSNRGTAKTVAGYTTASIAAITPAPAISSKLKDHTMTIGLKIKF